MSNEIAKIILTATHGKLCKIRDAFVVEGTINALKVSFNFTTSDWNDTIKTAVFIYGQPTTVGENDPVCVVLDENNECIVPSELLNRNGTLSIGVFGIKENYRIVSNWVHYKMENGCYTDGRDPIDPESTIYEQIMEAISTKQNKLVGGTGIKINDDTISVDPFIVTVTHDNDSDTYSADKTFVEIISAIESGQNALLFSNDTFYNMVYASEADGEIVFRYLLISDLGQFVINFVIYNDDTVEMSYADMYFQSDYEQNNENASDYIINRPCYKISDETFIGNMNFIASSATAATYTFTEEDFDIGNYFQKIINKTVRVEINGYSDECDVIFDKGSYYLRGTNLTCTGYFNTGNTWSLVIKNNKTSLTMGRSYEVSFYDPSAPVYKTLDINYLPSEVYTTLKAPIYFGTGEYSTRQGYGNTASGNSSHSEGQGTIASGAQSHTEGWYTIASGNISHSEGAHTESSGECSHTEGSGTIAASLNQHAQGRFNIEDSVNVYADIIGNGSSSTNRSNAATVDWSGNAWYAGDVYIGSTSGTNKDEGSKKLATEESVDFVAYDTRPYIEWIYLNSDESGNLSLADYTFEELSNLIFENYNPVLIDDFKTGEYYPIVYLGEDFIVFGRQTLLNGELTAISYTVNIDGTVTLHEEIRKLGEGQSNLTAGDGIAIDSNNVISSTYKTFIVSYESPSSADYWTSETNPTLYSQLDKIIEAITSEKSIAVFMKTSSDYLVPCSVRYTSGRYPTIYIFGYQMDSGSEITPIYQYYTIQRSTQDNYIYVSQRDMFENDMASSTVLSYNAPTVSAVGTYVENKVAELVGSAPETLDTLNELAAALGDDPNFATTVATQLGNKVDKVDGKSLSTNDYTTEEKEKLAGIEVSANKTIVDTELSSTSENPVQNKVINVALSNKQSTPFTGVTSSITPSQVYSAIFTDKKDVIINCVDSTFGGLLIFTSFEIHPSTNTIFSSAVRVIDSKPTLYLLVGNMDSNTWTTSSHILDSGNTPITVDSELSNTSENPVQNKVINTALAEKSKVTLKTWTTADMT